MADKNRILVSNIGRAIIKKLAFNFEGRKILIMGDFNMFTCYLDL